MLVILQSIFIVWVISTDFNINIVGLNNTRYISCYFILNYDDKGLFYLYFSYMSFIIILLTNSDSVICCHFCIFYLCFSYMSFIIILIKKIDSVICCHFWHKNWKLSKIYINFRFQFWSAPPFEHTKFPLYIQSKHQTAEW